MASFAATLTRFSPGPASGEAVPRSAGPSLEDPGVRWMVGISIFLAGAAGLGGIFVWTRFLGASISSTILLGAILSSAGAGSWLLGKAAASLESPLRACAALETAAACFGIFAPSLFAIVDWVSAEAIGGAGISGAAADLLRLALSATLVLAPGFLLGGVLPLLISLVRPGRASRSISRLYFIASLGAITGLCAATFLLVPLAGLGAACTILGCLQFAGGTLAYLAARLADSRADFREWVQLRTRSANRREADSAPLGLQDRSLIGGLEAAGFGGMLCWLALTRCLIQIFGPSAQSRTMLAAAALTAFSLGVLAAARWLTRHCHRQLLFAASQVATGAAIFLLLVFHERIPYWCWWVSALVARSEEAYPLYLAVQYFLALAVFLAPALFLGLGLSAATAQLTRSRGAGGAAGRTLGGLLLGAAAGLVLGTCFFLPLLGLHWTLKIGALASLCAPWAVLARAGASATQGPATPLPWILTAASAALAPLVVGLPAADQRLLSFFPERREEAVPGFAASRAALLRHRLLFAEDSAAARTVVLQSPGGSVSLLINGRLAATDRSGLSSRKLAVHLPLVLHRDPRDILLLNARGEAAADSLLSYHPAGTVERVEDLPAVTRAALHLAPAYGSMLPEPGPRILVDDVRSFLRSRRRLYDVIVCEPLSPRATGTAEFFTREFYRDCSLRLREGGLLAQVLPARELPDPLVQSILRSFLRSFPSAHLFNTGGPGDFVLLGSREEIEPAYERWEERIRRPEVLADLAGIRVQGLLALLALQSHSAEILALFAGTGPLNSDDLPIVESEGPPAFVAGRRCEVLGLLDERRGPGRRLFITAYLKQRNPPAEGFRHAADLFLGGETRNPPLLLSALREYLRRAPEDLEAWEILSDELRRTGRNQAAVTALEEAREKACGVRGSEIKILRRQAAALAPFEREDLTPLSAGNGFPRSREILARCLSVDGRSHDRYYLELARLSLLEGDRVAACRWLSRAADYRQKNPERRSRSISDGEVAEMLLRARADLR